MTRKELIADLQNTVYRTAQEQGWRKSELAMAMAQIPKEVDALLRKLRRKAKAKTI